MDSNQVVLRIKGNKAWNSENVINTKTGKYRSVRKTNQKNLNMMKNWFKNGTFLDYILRDEAAFDLKLTNEETIKYYEALSDAKNKWFNYKLENKILKEDHLLNDEEKNMKSSFFEQFDNLVNKYKADGKYFSGLYSMVNGQPQEVGVEEINKAYELFKNIDEANQIVWTGVLSFKNQILDENNIFNPAQINSALGKQIKNMLRDSGWRKSEIDDAEIGWAYHTNTDNLHAHFFIYQKHKTRAIEKNGHWSKQWIDKYAMKKETLTDFKVGIEYDLSKNTTSFNESKTKNRNLNKHWFKNIQTLSNDLKLEANIPDEKVKEMLIKLKEFQTRNKQVLDGYKTYGSKGVPENFRKEINDITLNLISDIPELSKNYYVFLKENKKTSNEKFEKWLHYYKIIDDQGNDIETSSQIDLKLQQLELDDDKLELNTQDYENYFNNVVNENDEDYIQTAKNKKIEFEQEHIYSFNKNGYPQGILSEYSAKVFNMLKRQIYISKPRLNKNQPNHPLMKHEFKQDGFQYQQKQLTRKATSNTKWRLKRLMAEIDALARKRTRDAIKGFHRIQWEVVTKEKEMERMNEEWIKP